jgi:protein TonB
MPHDLFGDVLVRPQSARPRRSVLVIFSIAAHTCALAAVLIVPLVATGALPLPQRALTIFVHPDVVPIVLPPPRHTGPLRPVTTAVVDPSIAPIEAPEGVAPERVDAVPRGGPESDGPAMPGIVDGLGAAGVGVITAPPAPPPVVPVRLHSGIREPRKIVDVPPVYPQFAQASRIEGLVIIEATIDARGAVQSARVLRSLPFLDEAALDAVRQWRYTPALLNGVPVPVIMTVTVNFRLHP